ncbi:MAG: MarR family transcriptional regulator [Ruminococcus sp.]|nr:MarR family transcriptional regulator [Ruminococcus sp.]
MPSYPEELKKRPRRLLENPEPEPSMFIADIANTFGRMIVSDFPEEGTSDGYRRMFRTLCLNDGLTQVELARAAGLTSPSVSAALNKMEADGLVRRVPDEKDRRKVYVYITEKGRERDREIIARCREVESIMLRGVSESERSELLRLLRKLLCNLIDEEDR